MKPTLPSVLAVSLACAAALVARADYTVHAEPDTASAILGTLPASTRLPSPQPGSEGWVPATVPSVPVSGWVRNADIGKDLEVNDGAVVRAEAREDAAPLATIAAGQGANVRIERVERDWSRVSLPGGQPGRGFVLLAPPVEPSTPEMQPVQTLPIADTPPPATGSINAAGTPRIFAGTFRPTRRILGFGPSYPYQIVGADGRRIALLDVRNLLVTTDITSYVNRTVQVRGVAVPTDTGRDVVVVVDTLTLQ
jgi:hypothetical protein